ncbi:MAG: hypothetical protein IJY20_01760 [Clostridia bacterium]|nr:hypothetical protein [Clostridia bacterium]
MARRMGEAPLPQGRAMRVTRLGGFRGLDRRGGVRDGYLAACEGIDPRELPALTTMRTPTPYRTCPAGKTLALQAIGSAIFRVYTDESGLYLARYQKDGSLSRTALSSEDTTTPRTLLPYNLYSNPQDPLSGSYQNLVILFPDCVIFDPQAPIPKPEALGNASSMPSITHACVHLSRVFGANEDRLYACAFNDPRNWNLDTATSMDASHAWASTVQSNTRASGDFTAMTVYDGHVLAFKRRFCHILNNNKNPFRVADLLTVGTPDGRTIAEVEGKLFFVADEGVYRYNGDSATLISDVLDVADFSGALAAGAAGLYWLYLPALDRVLVWSEANGAWSMLSPFADTPICGMTADEKGCYMIDEGGILYTFEGGRMAAFTVTTPPLLQEAIGRLSRLSLSLTAEAGATLTVTYTDTGGHITPLLQHTGNGRTVRVESRVFTPADYGGSLHLSGTGKVTVHDLILKVANS